MSKAPPSSDYAFHTHVDELNVGQPEPQKLAREVAIAINYNGVNHAVMMATPVALEDFALGYSLTAGIVSARQQILDVEARIGQDAVHLDIALSQRAFHQYKRERKFSRRTDAGSGGCGLCGVEALEQVLNPSNMDLPRTTSGTLPSPIHLQGLRNRFSESQQERNISGAMHAAIYVDARGSTRMCREDIGRHNALDKLIGGCSRQELPLDQGFVAISSRCGLELVQKAVRCGIATLVSLSSPSDIAVRWARCYRLNLIHVPASDAPRVYSACTEWGSSAQADEKQYNNQYCEAGVL